MPIDQLLLFISVTFIVSASPGPVMLACMNNGARYGVRNAVSGMIGASLGNMCLVVLSALGLGLLVHNSALVFNAIKWLGAFYLVVLGLQQIRQPIIKIDSTSELSSTLTPSSTPSTSLIFSALFIAVSNPKGLIYFGALFPQFIDYRQPLAWQYLVFTVIFLVSDLGWMLAYAAMGNRIMGWLKTPKHQTLFNAISGGALMGAGLIMAIAAKP